MDWVETTVGPMEMRQLGHPGLLSPAIGFGAMGLSQGYGPADDAESVRVIHRALELGVRLLDTAMSYGRGHNEELVGRAIASRRAEVVLATKFGIVREPDGVRLDGRPDHVRGYCEASLRRLGVEVIDLYYLHRVDPGVPIAETVGAMADLVTAGKVRHLGLSEAGVEDLEAASAVHPIAALQLEWSLLWREPEAEVIPAARALGIGVVPYSPLGRGLLTGALSAVEFAVGDFRHGDPRFSGAEFERNRELVGALQGMAAERGVTVGQLALGWLLAQGPDVVPIPGTRRPERLAENAAAAGITLDGADLTRIAELAPRSAWAGDRTSFAARGLSRSPGT